MYSSLQQQCLVELGVIPYDLNDKYNKSDDVAVEQALVNKHDNKVEIHTKVESPVTRPRPSINKAPIQLNTAASTTPTTPTTTPEPVAIDYWVQCSVEFITDLKLVFPNVKFSVPAFGGLLAQLSEHVFWKVAPKMQAQYVQMESIEQNTVITSPLPAELTLSQKKELWLLLQPHALQPEQATQTIQENQ